MGTEWESTLIEDRILGLEGRDSGMIVRYGKQSLQGPADGIDHSLSQKLGVKLLKGGYDRNTSNH